MHDSLWSTARQCEPAILPELTRGEFPDGERSPANGRARAHQIMREAEREAQALVEAARHKAASLAQEGYQDGRLQGRAEGLAETRAQHQQLVAALEAGVARLRVLEEEFRAAAGALVVDLGLAVARRICRAAIVQDPTIVLDTVRGALALLPENGEAVVRVHPDHLAMIREQQPKQLESVEGAISPRLVPDPAVEPGGCLVETPGCLVDATLSGQIEEAGRRLRGDPR
jgi:flagellar assembly protein FliH